MTDRAHKAAEALDQQQAAARELRTFLTNLQAATTIPEVWRSAIAEQLEAYDKG